MKKSFSVLLSVLLLSAMTCVSHGQALTLEQFGGRPDGGITDNTIAWEQAKLQLSSNGCRIQLNAGDYRFLTKPSPPPACLVIDGISPSSSWLSRGYAPGNTSDVFWDLYNIDGPRLQHLSIVAADNSTGLALVYMQTGTTPSGVQMLDDVWLTYTGTSCYTYPFLANGYANQTPGSQGLRDITLRGVKAFISPCSVAGIVAEGVVNPDLVIWSNGDVWIWGATGPQKYNADAVGRITTLGTLYYANTHGLNITGIANQIVSGGGNSYCHMMLSITAPGAVYGPSDCTLSLQ